MTAERLERRVQRWEDTLDIQRLEYECARLIDEGLRAAAACPEQLLDLFADDAVWQTNHHGRFEGKEGVRELFGRLSATTAFSLHYMLNPVIELAASGVEATGRWMSFETLTVDGEAVWSATRYDNLYTKDSGRWRFRRVQGEVLFMTPFDQGWARQRFVA